LNEAPHAVMANEKAQAQPASDIRHANRGA
jgi:hypothetical protein